jgi:hypothetical protein
MSYGNGRRCKIIINCNHIKYIFNSFHFYVLAIVQSLIRIVKLLKKSKTLAFIGLVIYHSIKLCFLVLKCCIRYARRQIYVSHIIPWCQVLCGSSKKLPRTLLQCCYIFLSFGIIDASTIKCWDLSTAKAGARGREGCYKFSLSLMYRLNQTESAILL